MEHKPVQLDTTKLSHGIIETGQIPSPDKPEAGSAGGESLATPEQIKEIENKVIEELQTCYDPEIPVNIYELGLIYNVEVNPAGAVHIRMTLTSPACPAAGSLPPEVQYKVQTIPGVTSARVEIVWDPPWDKNRMSEAARRMARACGA